jgi:hypothetical protein
MTTQEQMDAQLHRLGVYRIRRALQLADVGAPDGISGALLMGVSSRETNMQNIVGGGYFDSTGKWHVTGEDRGAFQISVRFHLGWLIAQPGCLSGSWTPTPGRSAGEIGYVPQWSTGCQYAIDMLRSNSERAQDVGIPESDAVFVAVAGYNRGIEGACNAYRAGKGTSDERREAADRGTTGGDYAADVFARRGLVNANSTVKKILHQLASA